MQSFSPQNGCANASQYYLIRPLPTVLGSLLTRRQARLGAEGHALTRNKLTLYNTV